MRPNSRYVVVSPVKDEAQHIEGTLISMVRQTWKPAQWVIVDDGSQDRTAAIVERYAAEHPFIRLTSSGRAQLRDTGTAEAKAFEMGTRCVATESYEFIVKLDGDLTFDPNYFEDLLERFAHNERLGIASGVYLEPDRTGSWTVVPMPAYHAFGACKVVRAECFRDIGGFLTTPGWDTVDEIRAWLCGWDTTHFGDLHVKHHRPEGSAMGALRTSMMQGRIYYLTGGEPLLLPLKVVKKLSARPIGLTAAALATGYLDCWLRRSPLLVSQKEAREYRRRLRRRVFGS